METHRTVVQPAIEQQTGASSKPYTPASYRESAIDVESLVSGALLFGMLGFVCMLFVGCFDAGLIA